MRRIIVVYAMTATSISAVEADAQCCGAATTAYYQPAAVTAYSPVASTGWYPGYYWNRVRTRLFGSPSTYVAAYPATTYAASYAPAYTASYAPSYTASYAPTYATSYAAPAACPSCPTCSSCTVGYAPSTACPACPTCPTEVFAHASYAQPACPTCGVGTASVQQRQDTSTTQSPELAPPQTFAPTTSNGGGAGGPSVPADTSETERREGQKPETNGTELQPGPGDTDETPVEDPYKVNNSSDSSTMFEAPKLHDPNDRTAQRAIAPVKTALYKQPVAYRNVSTQRVTAEQARQDAIGWSSVSK